MSFKIITDSTSNLPDDLIEKLDIDIVSLSFFVKGVEYKSYEKGVKTDLIRFYDMMRNKELIKTSLVSPEQFKEVFEKYLETGRDVLCLTLSSGVSGTFQSAVIAMEELKSKYPQRKIYVIDTLNGSLGQGLLVYKAAEMRDANISIDDVNDWMLENRLKLCNWFTVEDLHYLSRTGRVTTSNAFFGTLLGIKPILHVDTEGKLIPVEKVRGRKQSLDALITKFDKLAVDKENQLIAISHADCEGDALYIENRLKKEFNIKNILINCMDPVLGAHGGGGSLCLFFWSDAR